MKSKIDLNETDIGESPVCFACNDKGMIGGFDGYGYDSEECPFCLKTEHGNICGDREAISYIKDLIAKDLST